jgi:hypothetical protein
MALEFGFGFRQVVLFYGTCLGICLFAISLNIKTVSASYRYSWLCGLGIHTCLFFLAAQFKIDLSIFLFICMLGIATFQIFKYIYDKYED